MWRLWNICVYHRCCATNRSSLRFPLETRQAEPPHSSPDSGVDGPRFAWSHADSHEAFQEIDGVTLTLQSYWNVHPDRLKPAHLNQVVQTCSYLFHLSFRFRFTLALLINNIFSAIYKRVVLLISVKSTLAEAKISNMAKAKEQRQQLNLMSLSAFRGSQCCRDFLFPTAGWEEKFMSGRLFLPSSGALDQLQRNKSRRRVWLGSCRVLQQSLATDVFIRPATERGWEVQFSFSSIICVTKIILNKFPVCITQLLQLWKRINKTCLI